MSKGAKERARQNKIKKEKLRQIGKPITEKDLKFGKTQVITMCAFIAIVVFFVFANIR